jgi:hypothetical protein
MTTETVKLLRDAQGGHCATCNSVYNVTTCPYWAWNKSVAMHRDGTGHVVTLYRIVG